jgi:hypothetical protein
MLRHPVAAPGNCQEDFGGLPGYVRPIPLAPGRWWGNKLRYATGREPLWATEVGGLLQKVRPDIIHLHHTIGFGIKLLV